MQNKERGGTYLYCGAEMADGAIGPGNQSGEVQNRQFEETVVGFSGLQAETASQKRKMGGQVSDDRKGVSQVQGYHPRSNPTDR